MKKLATIAGAVLVMLLQGPMAGAVEIQSICRLKGQEPIRLTGLGLVVGLDGTGDARFTPMHTAVARALGLLGNPVTDLREVATVRNVALVTVSCEIPGTGAAEGQIFDCFVTSIGTAKSLAAGRLLRTPLGGPISEDDTVYALAEGPVTLEGLVAANHGRILSGAKLTVDLLTPDPMRADGTLTLIIDNAHASWVTARRIADAINDRFGTQTGGEVIARARDQKHIHVSPPQFERDDLVGFVADLMQTELVSPNTQARVVINEKSGTVAVTGEVELEPILITHRNLVIFPPGQIPLVGAQLPPNDFTALANAGPPGNQPLPATLNDLMIALNRAQVSAADKIAVIRELAKSGKLHARVIHE